MNTLKRRSTKLRVQKVYFTQPSFKLNKENRSERVNRLKNRVRSTPNTHPKPTSRVSVKQNSSPNEAHKRNQIIKRQLQRSSGLPVVHKSPILVPNAGGDRKKIKKRRERQLFKKTVSRPQGPTRRKRG